VIATWRLRRVARSPRRPQSNLLSVLDRRLCGREFSVEVRPIPRRFVSRFISSSNLSRAILIRAGSVIGAASLQDKAIALSKSETRPASLSRLRLIMGDVSSPLMTDSYGERRIIVRSAL
jgi:hypothetical protein